MKYQIILLCVLQKFSMYAQQIDAKAKKQAINDDINTYLQEITTNPNKAFFHICRAYESSVSIDNDSLSARCLCNIGNYYCIKTQYALAQKKLHQSIALAQKAKYYRVLSSSYNLLGNTYEELSNYNTALQYYLKGLEITEQHQIFDIKSRILNSLAVLYLIQKDTLTSIKYCEVNIKNAEQNHLDGELFDGYTNLAIILHNKNKILELYQKALALAQKNENLYQELTIYIALANIESNKTLFYLTKAEQIQEKLDDESLSFNIYYAYADYYNKLNDTEKALYYYQKALVSSKDVPKNQTAELYKSIYKLYKKQNNHKNALLFHEKYNTLSDSLFNVDKNKIFNEIQTKYEVDKKNLRISWLSKEKEIEHTKKNIVLAFALLSIIPLSIILIIYRSKIKSQQIIKEKEAKIYQQQLIQLEQEQEIEKVKSIVEGQNIERNRIARDLHDGIGGKLAGLKLKLSQINEVINNTEIATINVQMTDVFQELRNISHNLSSSYIKEKPFEVLLSNLKEEYEFREEFLVEFIIYPPDTLSSFSIDKKENLYRIIQELLTNVSKHAKAKNVYITITALENEHNIMVEDDGIGFVLNKNKGIGIANIEERIKILNAKLKIDSNNNGTTIIIDLPF